MRKLTIINPITHNFLLLFRYRTDITFVMVRPNTQFKLIKNTDDGTLFTGTKIDEIGNILKDDGVTVENIRPPYLDSQAIRTRITKSYVWWLDDPWAALIALVAISILLCIVGIIVIIFTSSR